MRKPTSKFFDQWGRWGQVFTPLRRWWRKVLGTTLSPLVGWGWVQQNSTLPPVGHCLWSEIENQSSNLSLKGQHNSLRGEKLLLLPFFDHVWYKYVRITISSVCLIIIPLAIRQMVYVERKRLPPEASGLSIRRWMTSPFVDKKLWMPAVL